jgi:uncharacterized protein (DUF1697 family)
VAAKRFWSSGRWPAANGHDYCPSPKTLHLFFLDSAPQGPDLDALEAFRAGTERYQLINNVFYLHAPGGIGWSKLAVNVGKGWDVAITARNWRTVSEIMVIAKQQSSYALNNLEVKDYE